MKDILASPSLYIKNQFIAGTCYPLLLCDFFGLHKKFRHEGLIPFSEVIDASNMFLWNQKDVDRCTRVCVLKSNHPVPLKHEAGRFCPFNNLTKNTVLLHWLPISSETLVPNLGVIIFCKMATFIETKNASPIFQVRRAYTIKLKEEE